MKVARIGRRRRAWVKRSSKTALVVRVVYSSGVMKTETYRRGDRIPLQLVALLCSRTHQALRKRAAALGIVQRHNGRGGMDIPFAQARALRAAFRNGGRKS